MENYPNQPFRALEIDDDWKQTEKHWLEKLTFR